MDELQKILEAAENLFAKYGVRSVSMNDIAQQLGMSKKTLYVHIENKHDLIDKVMARYISKEKEMCSQVCSQAVDALDEMLRMSMHVQADIEELNPSLLFDLRKYHFPVWQQFEQYRKGFILEMMSSNLERGKKEGIYRADLNPEIISGIHVATIELFADDDLLPPDRFPRPLVHKQFIMYHLYGIVSDEGRLLLEKYLNQIQNNSNL